VIPELLAIGDSSIDEFLKLEDDGASELSGSICFIHGTKVPVETYETSIAGNALNVSVGTARLGVKTMLYTEIGDDQNSYRIINELKSLNVDTTFCVQNPNTPTDVHPVVIYKEDRTIFIYHGKRNYKILEWPKPKWVYYSSIGKDFEKFQKELVEYVKANTDIGVIFNPGTYHLKQGVDPLREFLSEVDILFVNKEEAQKLVSCTEFSELHKNLQQLGPKLTVITNGSKGASGSDGTQQIDTPAFIEETPVMDKTGAGDAFSSGFISAIIQNRSLKEALLWGSMNSSGVIRKIGAIEGLRGKEEILNLINTIK
jgi:ribokinase